MCDMAPRTYNNGRGANCSGVQILRKTGVDYWEEVQSRGLHLRASRDCAVVACDLTGSAYLQVLFMIAELG